jgi:hypothetical protein
MGAILGRLHQMVTGYGIASGLLQRASVLIWLSGTAAKSLAVNFSYMQCRAPAQARAQP